MHSEKLEVVTEAGKTLQVELLSRSTEAIWVVLGEGMHNVKCKLTPTNNGLAYAGSVMGREIVYRRSVKQVQGDIARLRLEQNRYRGR